MKRKVKQIRESIGSPADTGIFKQNIIDNRISDDGNINNSKSRRSRFSLQNGKDDINIVESASPFTPMKKYASKYKSAVNFSLDNSNFEKLLLMSLENAIETEGNILDDECKKCLRNECIRIVNSITSRDVENAQWQRAQALQSVDLDDFPASVKISVDGSKLLNESQQEVISTISNFTKENKLNSHISSSVSKMVNAIEEIECIVNTYEKLKKAASDTHSKLFTVMDNIVAGSGVADSIPLDIRDIIKKK